MKGLPIEHLIASVASEPFAEEAAFGLGELNSNWSDDRIVQLWSQCEARFLHQWHSLSVDELFLLRDSLWCDANGKCVSRLVLLWRDLCRRFLKCAGPVALPVASNLFLKRLDGTRLKPDSDSRRLWRWLTFSLPEDSLLAGCWKGRDCPLSVQSQPASLADQLKRHGFAEPHLHLAAAAKFSDLWISAMRVVGGQAFTPRSLQALGGCFQDGKWLADWLLRAAIVRVVIAAYLSSGSSETFASFLERIVYPRLARRSSLNSPQVLVSALNELMCGRLGLQKYRVTTFADLQQIYRILAGYKSFGRRKDNGNPLSPREESLVQFRQLDPIQGYFPGRLNGPAPELFFQAACFSRFETEAHIRDAFGSGSMDRRSSGARELEALFWQYFRIRNIFYRHIVLRPLTPGLPFFIRTFTRISPALAAMSYRARLESAAEISGKGQGLLSLEVRTSPKDDRETYYAFFQELQRTAADVIGGGSSKLGCDLEEVGVVVHFVRTRGVEFEKGKSRPFGQLTSGEPNTWHPRAENRTSFRYGTYYKRVKNEVGLLVRYLRDNPDKLRLIRGFDACNDEGSVPLWVIAPCLNLLREEGQRIAAESSVRNGEAMHPLRATIHVGEDFLHVQTGLRRIWEVIEHLHYQAGDRLGHAIALGINVEQWVAKCGHVLVRKKDRLFDLLWELQLYRRGDCTPDPARMVQVEHWIETLGREIFFKKGGSRPAIQVDDLLQLYGDLFDGNSLEKIGFPDGNGLGRQIVQSRPIAKPMANQNVVSKMLLEDYLKSVQIFHQSQQEVCVDVRSECQVLCNLQATVMKLVANRRIVVEVNPSSNLLVGNLGDLSKHPLVQITAGQPNQGQQCLAVIGSDDPLTFSSPLPQEYILMHDAFIEAGVSPLEADRWIDRLREQGLESRFTGA